VQVIRNGFLSLLTLGALTLEGHAQKTLVVSLECDFQLASNDDWNMAASTLTTSTLNAITCLLAAALKETGVAVNSVCPGWCRTEMGGSEAPRSVEEGAAGIVWLAADAPQSKTGLFWRDKGVISW